MDLYLAGSETPEHAYILHALEYPFRLASYYGVTDSVMKQLRPYVDDGSAWILDSGLFSFMFGAAQGKMKSYDDYKSYASRYVDDVVRWGWKHPIVECDVQRVLGVDENERLRAEVFDPSGLDIIYVWHIPDGEEALVRLASTKRRIALSVPEIRKVLGTGVAGGHRARQALIHLLKLCRAGTARVHLLGCTEPGLIRLPGNSGDSSSWLYPVRYAYAQMYSGGKIDMFSIYTPKWRAWVDWCRRFKPSAFAKLDARRAGADRNYTLAASVISYWLLMDSVNT